MPIEGVDTFSCLCVPDLECAISGAADNDVVSHLGWPHAPCVAHQCAQTLTRSQKKKKSLDEYSSHCYCNFWMSEKFLRHLGWFHSYISHLSLRTQKNLICTFSPHCDLLLPSGKKRQVQCLAFISDLFWGKEELSRYLPAAVLGRNLSLSFYNCFYLSVGKADYSFSLQKGLTTVFNWKMPPFILIRDGSLAIDYSSSGNISDQLNLCLHKFLICSLI